MTHLTFLVMVFQRMVHNGWYTTDGTQRMVHNGWYTTDGTELKALLRL